MMRDPFAYGKVTATAGTPVAVTANFSSDAEVKDESVGYLTIKALPTNSGKVYIGYSNMNTSTMVGVLDVLLPGTSYAVGKPNVSAVRARDFYIDVETTGEGVISAGYR